MLPAPSPYHSVLEKGKNKNVVRAADYEPSSLFQSDHQTAFNHVIHEDIEWLNSATAFGFLLNGPLLLHYSNSDQLPQKRTYEIFRSSISHAGCASWCPTNSVKAVEGNGFLEATVTTVYTFRDVLADYVSSAATTLQHAHGLLVRNSTEIDTVYLQNRCDETSSFYQQQAATSATVVTAVLTNNSKHQTETSSVFNSHFLGEPGFSDCRLEFPRSLVLKYNS